RAYPRQVLVDLNALESNAACAGCQSAADPEETQAVPGGRVWSLIEDVQAHRAALMRQPSALLFPELPATEEDLERQGFKLVRRDELAAVEPESAKKFWSSRGKVAWYEHNQP